MAEHSELHAFVGHENPSIVRHAARLRRQPSARGRVRPAAPSPRSRARARSTSRWSAPTNRWRRAWSTRCSPRARAPSVPRAPGAEIEWNKAFARSLLAEVAPEAAPLLRVVRDARELDEAIASFGSTPVAVKPAGLTGGKGVKVMGPHLADHAQAREYALRAARARRAGRVGADRGEDRRRRVHDPGDQRRPDGGVPALDLRLPVSATTATRGPGTGGMGSLSMAGATLPFMTARPLRAGLLDRRARDRAPARRRAATSAA